MPLIQETRATFDNLRFLTRLIRTPRSVGAVAPSSGALARAMTHEILPFAGGPVLELGPGTGVFTGALIAAGIAPENITVIEYDAMFANLVRKRYPTVNLIQGDAFNLLQSKALSSTKFCAVLSGIPLLNFDAALRRQLVLNALALTKENAPFVQFSYGLQPPVPASPPLTVGHVSTVWFNFPPARVWVYQARNHLE